MRPTKTLLFIIILAINISFSISTNSQTVKGRVTTTSGETIPYSSIYLKETTFGTTTNDNGDYEIQLLHKGTYNITFQSIGFQKQERTVTIDSGQVVKLNVVLPEQVYLIKEVRVYSNNEDPAYAIMRKAISMAPYYLRQTSHYDADVYLKGSLVLDKVPKIIKHQMEKDEDANLEIGRRYTSESMNEITFDEPDKYNHKVISSRSSFPTGDENSTMGLINSSFYQPEVDLIISPLSPNAFSHYKFEFIDFFKDGHLYINKIKIIPRRKSQQLVSGTIYIIEDLWCIYSLDVIADFFYGATRIKQTYSQVKDNAWLPTSHRFDIDASVFGIKARFNYVSSVKYKEVELNKNLPTPELLKAGFEEIANKEETLKAIEQEQKSKEQQKIDQLLAKEDMNNRDMIKLARLMEKESRKQSEPDTSLEIKTVETYKFDKPKKDTLKTDTAYWNAIRPIPLSTDELETFVIKDSLKIVKQEEEKADTTKTKNKKKKKSAFSKATSAITNGKTFEWCDSKLYFTYDGLLKLKNIGFNPVEALWLKQSFEIKLKTDSLHWLKMYPWVKYSFGQERVTWNTVINYDYAPMHRGQLWVNFGQYAEDFYGYPATTPFVNLGYNLLLKENYSKLFHQDYLKIDNLIDIANGLQLITSVKYANYEHLNNTSKYSFVKKDDEYPINDPINTSLGSDHLKNQKEASFEFGLNYTPAYHYKIEKGHKKMVYSKYPTFKLKYKQGLPDIFNSISEFSQLDFTIDQTQKWGIFDEFKYSLNGGYFINHYQNHFSTFKHFNTVETEFEIKSIDNGFALLRHYEASTNKWYAQAHVNYTSSVILLKYLPFFSNRLWLENLYMNYLTTPAYNNYCEIGYGISQIFFFAEVGVYGGFNDFDPDRWGLKLIFHFND